MHGEIMQGQSTAQANPSLNELFTTRAIRLIKAKWLKEYLEAGRGFVRRQELPDEAFVPHDRAVELVGKCSCTVISHAWLSPKHPDAGGVRARDLLKVLQWDREAVFFDFFSLHHVPRRDVEDVLFKQALGSLHKVFSNPRWFVVSLTTVRGTSPNPRPYFERGWCMFEATVAKVGALGWSQIRDGEFVPGERELRDQPEPMIRLPEDFAQIVDQLHFTSVKADPNIVKQLYQRIWPEISGKDVFDLKVVSDEELRQIERVVPFLPNCNMIYLSRLGTSKGQEQKLQSTFDDCGIECRWLYIPSFFSKM